jgi:hypothetical protein
MKIQYQHIGRSLSFQGFAKCKSLEILKERWKANIDQIPITHDPIT